MATFQYKAIDETGNKITGQVEADSQELVNHLLEEKGLLPVSIKKVKGKSGGGSKSSGSTLFAKKLKTKELILYTKQLRTMLKAGIPILDILKTMEEQAEHPRLKQISMDVAKDIREGSNIYDAFKKHPKVFSNLYCSMLRAGEISGSLPEVLDRLIYILDHEDKIKSDIKSATRYPKMVIMSLFGAFFILLMVVIPKFVNVFNNARLELPVPTKICIFLNAQINNYWHVGLVSVVGGIVLLNGWLKTEQGQYSRDLFMLRLPVIGPLFVKSAMSRFSSIFAILQSSGVAVLESIAILTETIGNHAIARELRQVGEKLSEGQGFSQPLREARFFPPMVVNMIAIGEETGEIEEMMVEVSNHYDTEVEFATKQLSEAITPILTVGLTAVVGFFAMAIFLPMWNLTQMVH